MEGKKSPDQMIELQDQTKQDQKETVRLYRLAADQGDAKAQNGLGFCYAEGQGVAQDDKEAVRLFRLAAEKGHAPAQYNLGVCYRHGQGVAQDHKEAVRLFRLAAKEGDAWAQCNLERKAGYGINRI